MNVRHTRSHLRRSIALVAVVLLLACAVGGGIFYSSMSRSVLQRVSQTESAYADMLLSRASTLFEQIKKHCYMLSDVSVPYAALSDRLSTGLWTRKLIGKLFSGSSDYIAYVRLNMNGYAWSQLSGSVSRLSPEDMEEDFTQPLASYSLLDLYSEKSAEWPYYLSFRSRDTSSVINGMNIVVDTVRLGRQVFSSNEAQRREYILAADGMILLSNHPAEQFQSIDALWPGLLDQPASDESRPCVYGAYYVFFSEPDYYGMRAVTLAPRSFFRADFSKVYGQLALMICILLAIACCAVYFIVRLFYRPINEWLRLLSLYRSEDLQNYEDELSFITSSIQQYGQLIEQDSPSVLQRLTKLQEKQVAVQQYQIRTHFLFNALESIKVMSIEEIGSGNEIETSIVLLNEMISQSMEMAFIIPLSSEIRITRDYLGLMDIRFPGIRVSWSVDESLLAYRVFKFSMQPILENCYKHAFVRSGITDKRIDISVFSRDRDLVMRIADNGRGVDPAVLQRLNATLRAGRMDDYEGHIGLFNVHSRIQLLFGCDYGVFFLPVEKGSCVEIRYPLCAEMMADGLGRTGR